MKTPLDPRAHVIVASLAAAYSAIQLRRAMDRLRRWRWGLEGEHAVAEVLESMRAKGAKVFYDVPAEGFNVDHVVLAKQGVHVVETTTLSKRPRSSVTCDRGAVLVDGYPLDRDPLVQAESASALALAASHLDRHIRVAG
jgi:hypothetical protein